MVRLTDANSGSVREVGNRIAEILRLVIENNFRKGGANASPAIQSAEVLPAEDGVCRDACRGLNHRFGLLLKVARL